MQMKKMVPSSPGWFDSSQNLTDDKKQTLVFSGSDFLGIAQTSQIAAVRHNGRTEAFALEPRASDQICSFFPPIIWQFCSIHRHFRDGARNRPANSGHQQWATQSNTPEETAESRQPSLPWRKSWGYL